MADNGKRIGPQALTASAADIYTVPGGTEFYMRHIHVINNDTVTVDLTLSIGTDAAGTRLFDQTPVEPAANGGFLSWSGFLPLEAAEKIQAFGSTNAKLVITIGGVEVS